MTTFYILKQKFILLICFSIVFLFLPMQSFSVSSNLNTKMLEHASNSDNLEINDLFRYFKMISKGWDLIYRWDFYNQPLDWDISSAIRKATGGYIRIEEGEMQFGYSTLGAIIFYKTRLNILPNRSFLLIGRMKGNNPYRAMLGFYTPPGKTLHHFSYVKNQDWGLVSVVYEMLPYANQKIPKNLYPAVQVLTKQDNVNVDWIEFWMLNLEK